jgi:hypothetical protein
MNITFNSGLKIALALVYIVFGLFSYNYFGIDSPYNEIFSIALIAYGSYRMYRAVSSNQ